ncbi:hypothetical protein [Thermomonas sp. HDW16]|uniref:hypothetical protein n=1 Tax=Thermomonas sp. HDW16 TaxID=2714945 RepID=UPI0014087D6F|nr:hypothetical protein [Thermomonas sp. HDW16]QIL20160.1 hypothetical protein G7079_05075 [Thermomonas sp. HDW16]
MSLISPAAMPYAMTLGLGWLYYRRIRRHIGRQSWQPRRTMLRMGFLCLAVTGLLAAAVFLPGTGIRIAIGMGLIAGVVLGFLGLSLTTIDGDQHARWYTPNPWIGGALAVLLVGRLAWRMLHSGFIAQGAGQVQATPLTLGIAATLVGYYLSYSFLLMGRMRQLARAPSNAS